MKFYIKNFLALLISQGIRFPLSVLNMSVLARLLEPADIGKWAMVTSAATILHSIVLSWTQPAYVRFGCEEWEKNKTLSQTWDSRWPILVLGTILTLGLLSFQPFDWLAKIYKLPPNWWPIVFLFFTIIWLTAESQSVLQIIHKINLLAILLVVFTGLMILYNLLILLLTRPESNRLLLVLFGMIILSATLWGTVWIKTFLGTKPDGRWPERLDIVKIINYGWPLIPGFFIGYLSDWGDHLLLQIFYSQYEVGLFQIAYQVMLAIYGIATPLVTILVPHLIAGTIKDDKILIKFVNQAIPTITTIWVAGLIPLLILLPTIFIFIMGSKWSGSVPFLLVLSIAIPGSVITNLYSILFNIQNRLQRAMIIHLVMTVANISVSLLLLFLIGPLGSAIGTSCSYLISQYLYMLDQHKFMNLSVKKITFLYLIILFFGCCQAIITSLLMRVCFGLIFLTIYIFLVRGLRIADAQIIEDISFGKLDKVRRIIRYLIIGPRLSDQGSFL